MRHNAAILPLFILSSFLSCFAGVLPGQGPFQQTSGYHRLICLVKLTGAGTVADPIRPEYAPGSGERSRSGILAWTLQLADDKKTAIVQYVAADRKAFRTILDDKGKRQDIRVFEIGKDKRQDIEKELKKFKKDFDLDTLKVSVR